MAAAASGLGVGAGGSAAISNERLHDILSTVGVPMIELGFFPQDRVTRIQEQLCEHLPSKIINSLDDLTEASRARRSGFFNAFANSIDGKSVELSWDSTSTDNRKELLSYFASVSRSSGGFSASERSKLKKLPIFPTLAGSCVSVARPDAADAGSAPGPEFFTCGASVQQDQYPLSETASNQLLEPLPTQHGRELYENLEIRTLEEPDLVRKFVVPDFNALTPREKTRVITRIKSQWHQLSGNAETVETLKTLAFIPNAHSTHAQNKLQCARDFFDPRNDLLQSIFDDELSRFPSGIYLQPEWLDFLSKIGLVSEVTPDVFFECVAKVERDGAKQMKVRGFVDLVVVAKAERLLTYFKEEEHFTELYSVETVQRLSIPKFVPVFPPIVAQSYQQHGDGETGGQNKILVSFRECILESDRHLAWTVMPILSKRLQPQQMVCEKVGLQSPPDPSCVTDHLKLICDEEGTLLMSYPDPPEQVFATIMKYIEKKWRGMEDAARRREVAAMKRYFRLPIGSLLIRPSRLYFRLTENLAPFMFEVPRIFGPFEELLLQLGAKEQPQIENYGEFLSELKRETLSSPLNPNELSAVLRVIGLIVSNHERGGGANDGRIQVPYVPDDESRLIRPSECVFRDSPAMMQRVDGKDLQFASCRLSKTTCGVLDIPSMTAVVREELVSAEKSAEAMEISEAGTYLLHEQTLHQAIGMVLAQKDHSAPSASGNGRGMSPSERAEWVRNSLTSYRVATVSSVRTRFVLQISVGNCRAGTDVTRLGHADDNAVFVDERSNTIYMARGKMSEAFRLEQLVAMAVGKILDIPNVMLLATLFSVHLHKRKDSTKSIADDGAVETILRANGVCRDNVGGDERRRGQPGCEVSALDKQMITLAPLRAFLPGEIIAFEHKGDDARPVLKYAVVINTTGEADNTLKRVEILVRPGEKRTVISTEVYAFTRSSAQNMTNISDGPRSPSTLLRKKSSSDSARMIVKKTTNSSEDPSVGGDDKKDGVAPATANPLDNVKYIQAVEDILSKVNLSIDSSYAELMAETLTLRQELSAAKMSHNALETRVDQYEIDATRVAEAFTCTICMESEVNRTIVPSGRLICSNCANGLRGGTCPFTRQRITGFLPFFSPL
jgi:sacsin